MFFRELILVGLLTSLMVTMILYVTIGDISVIERMDVKHPSMIKQPKLRGAVEIKMNSDVNPLKYFVCDDQSSKTAIENDDFCDCRE